MPFSRIVKIVAKPLGTKGIANPQTIGEHIYNERMSLGLRQEDVAKMLKVSTDTATY